MTMESQIREFFGGRLSSTLTNKMISGTTIMGRINDTNKIVKIRLDHSHSIDNYDEVTVIIMDKDTNAKIDHQVFKFVDAWGRLSTTNTNFPDGVVPHIWDQGFDKVGWYVVKPNANQINYFVNRINAYINLFN